MAIKDYIRPMLEVHQQLEVTQFEVGDKMAACIVGADYDLYRYGYETITPTPFKLVDGSMTVPLVYERIPSLDYKLDTATITTYGEDMLAKVGKNPKSDTAGVAGSVSPNDIFVVRAPAGQYFSIIETDTDKLTAANAAFVDVADPTVPYAVQAGDLVLYAINGATDQSQAHVADLVGEDIAATVGTPVVTGMTASVTKSGKYALPEDTTLLLTITSVNGGICGYTITDTEGLMTAVSDVTSNDSKLTDVALGTSGITISATLTAPEIGAYIAIPCTAASVSSTKFNGLRLTNVAAPVDTAEEVTCYVAGVYKVYNGEITGWKQTVIEGTYENDNPKLQLDGKHPSLLMDGKAYPFANNFGQIYPSFRVMIQPQDTEDKYTITSIADIQKYFGTIAVENDLAYACYCALEGSAGRQLYALRVTDNTASAYTAALNKVETDASTYNFCVLSQDRSIIEAATAYVTKRSEPDFKRWCRVLVGVDTPGAYIVAAKDEAGVALKADIGLIVNSKTEATHVLQLAAGMNLDLLDLEFNGGKTQLFPGDQVQNTLDGQKWTIVEVKNATTVTMKGGPATNTKALPVRFWKADTPINAGEYVAALAEGLNMRRCSLVWSDKAVKEIDGKFTVMPNKYLAATVAGIGSAVVPQAPITHTEITTIDSAVRMYTKYTQKDLDNIAKDGVLIITQDAKDLPCYIRHQLTTETDKGVMYYEESCTRNLDNISYAVVDILEKYIGRANVTPSALRAIKVDMISVLNSFMDDSPADLIGPSLLSWTNLSIKQDTVFKDRVIVKVDLYLPLPLNNIKVYEMAYIADVTID